MDSDVIKAAYVLFIVPGQIPQKKGPFNTDEQLKKMLVEMRLHYPAETQYFVAEVTHAFDLWIQGADEFLTMLEVSRLPDPKR